MNYARYQLIAGLDANGKVKVLSTDSAGNLQISGTTNTVPTSPNPDPINSDSIIDPETTPIQTSGSGDKLILPAVLDQKIRIYSLYFVSSSETGIIFKAGNQAISGNMQLLTIATDFRQPLTVPLNTDFIITVQTNVNLNGFVIWVGS